MGLLQILTLLRRRASLLIDALTPRSIWGRRIYEAISALVIFEVFDYGFGFLIHNLPGMTEDAIRRMLPRVFITGSIFLVSVAAVLGAIIAADGSSRAKRPGMLPRDRQGVIRLILVLLAGAGIGLIDAQLSAKPAQWIDASDR